MTPDDAALITTYGSFLFSSTISCIVQFTGYGLVILGIFFAISSRQSISEERPKRILFVYLTVVYICSTWSVIYYGGFTLTRARYTFARVVKGGIAEQVQISNQKGMIWDTISPWPATINLLLSDLIVTWRAWVLFQEIKLLKLLLAFLMVANIGINLADCIWEELEINIAFLNSAILDWLSLGISLFVNLFSTSLITWRAWDHYRIMARASIHRRSPVQNVLLLLIESGAIFCAVQLADLPLTVLNTNPEVTFPTQLAFYTMNAITVVAETLYPVAVIILIHRNSSPVIETFHYTVSQRAHSE
ncbi:hypothetical protein GYMLUDRAFT_50682 [Collybiopsis luxurians FD-317 M1]|uniref:Uncharacterized protein n=1 Tax=Collybiopsis luxurians FD-317 M1 TaxID=944289 RepID=A0A0D0BAF0_9AGAR|nr:hypothetical protein GYMLUDRAFT_50682 [Collybiopsis luxurians FD-317 M1]